MSFWCLASIGYNIFPTSQCFLDPENYTQKALQKLTIRLAFILERFRRMPSSVIYCVDLSKMAPLSFCLEHSRLEVLRLVTIIWT